MPNSVLRALHILTHEVGIIFIPVLQIRKLRHTEEKQLVQDHTDGHQQSQDSKAGNLAPESTLLTIILLIHTSESSL